MAKFTPWGYSLQCGSLILQAHMTSPLDSKFYLEQIRKKYGDLRATVVILGCLSGVGDKIAKNIDEVPEDKVPDVLAGCLYRIAERNIQKLRIVA